MITFTQKQTIQTALNAIRDVFLNMPNASEPVDYDKLQSVVFSLNPLTQRLVNATSDTELQDVALLVQYHASQYLGAINGDSLSLIDETSSRMSTMIFAFNIVFLVAGMDLPAMGGASHE